MHARKTSSSQIQLAHLHSIGRPQYASKGACRARTLVLQLPPRGARRELRRDFGRVDAKTANQDPGVGIGDILYMYISSVAHGVVVGAPSADDRTGYDLYSSLRSVVLYRLSGLFVV